MTNKKKGRDPKKAEDSRMKLAAAKIEKILIENELGLHPFIYTNPYNGAQTPQVRLISTKAKANDIDTGNQEAAGDNQDEEGAAAAE